MRPLRGLYAITPDGAAGEDLLARVRAALGTGRPSPVGALQYRNKLASPAARRSEARALAGLCRAQGVAFIVNDDVELALEVGADGVHLGRADGDLAAARRRAPGLVLGASCYNELPRAQAAAAAGADYIAFGRFYASVTKPQAVQASPALFAAARPLGLAQVAIGGITLHNAPGLIRAGADMVAVISDLFDAPDIAARALAYASLFEEERP